jgi:hypothetical protein
MEPLADFAGVKSFDADSIMREALDALYGDSPQRLPMQQIRERTVRMVRSAEVERSVGRAIGKLSARARAQVLSHLREFARRRLDGSDPALWPWLDAARSILRECQVFDTHEMRTCDRDTLLNFDVLLAGAVGEPRQIWSGCA